eukprot:4263908-Pyramimonas_sp.AAC.1
MAMAHGTGLVPPPDSLRGVGQRQVLGQAQMQAPSCPAASSHAEGASLASSSAATLQSHRAARRGHS